MPVRPSPVWISSNTSAAPTRSQAARAACSSSSLSTLTPVSPWIGSSSTAAVRSPTAASSASTSRGTGMKPGTSGAKGACLDSWNVADSAPYVRPWKPPCSTTMSPRGRALRTSLSAASFASAPEFAKYTRPPSDAADNRFASSTIGRLKYRFETCISVPACARIAATTAGWQWPVLQTEIPARKSR